MAVPRAASKWIAGLSAEQPVADAARKVLEIRLGKVWELLPAAAFEAEEDAEHVHQLRVASRRAHAALRAFADCLPRRRGRKVIQQLHQVRRAAGAARDFDVQQARLTSLADAGHAGAGEVAARVARKRRQAQAPIVRVQRRLEAKRFVDQVTEMLARLREPERAAGEVRLGEFAGEQLAREARRFFAAEAFVAEGYAALHRFRIRAKALRYTLEIFADVWGTVAREQIYPVVERVQELLGDVVDCHVAIDRYDGWRRDSRRGSARHALAELAERERAELQARLEKFGAWWTRERSESLHKQIASLTAGQGISTIAIRRAAAALS